MIHLVLSFCYWLQIYHFFMNPPNNLKVFSTFLVCYFVETGKRRNFAEETKRKYNEYMYCCRRTA